MDNYEIGQQISRYAKLLELHNGNDFKIKALQNAAFTLKKIQDPLFLVPETDWTLIRGIGKTIVSNLKEIKETGKITGAEELMAITPVGVLEILKIKGLGPKKVSVIWKELGIENLDDLYNACRENRLIETKGFGVKTQLEIIKNVEFLLASAGKWHFARIIGFAESLLQSINTVDVKAVFCKDIALTLDIIETIDFAIYSNLNEVEVLLTQLNFEKNKNYWINEDGLKVNLMDINTLNINEINLLFATPKHVVNANCLDNETLENAYIRQKVNVVPVYMRQGNTEFLWNKKYIENDLISFTDLKGCLHNHSSYSDGMHSLPIMAKGCIDLNLAYFGICDHSKSAFYANGLNEDRLYQQWSEIDELNTKLNGFKIFKGIESDILNNGNLDYSDDILAKFDFIVASVHSNLKMDKETATTRLIKAIENPYTRILGHPTGRLLLMRNGYEIEYDKIIDACSANNVAIELNAHPYRLDLDWKFMYQCMEKNVLISINPDAHEVDGLNDMHWGVIAAKKGGLVKDFCLNAKSLTDFENWLSLK